MVGSPFLISSSRSGTMRFHHKGHPSANRGATAGFRIDRKLAAYQVQPLPHADKSYAATVHGVLRIKANSRVTHGQLYLPRCSAQFHSEVPRAAVLDCIL